MSNAIDQDWAVANQQYLMASLQMVREELEFYHSNPEGMASFEPSAEVTEALEILAESLISPAAIEILSSTFNLSSFESKILLMCAGVELVADFSTLLGHLHGNEELIYPSFNLAVAAFSDAHWSAISPAAPLRYWNLIKLKNNTLIAKSPLQIDEAILHFLTGFLQMEENLHALLNEVALGPTLVPSHEALVDTITETCLAEQSEARLPVLQLEGNGNRDQMTIAAAVAQSMGRRLYRLSAHSIPEKHLERTQLQRLWNRESALYAFALFVDTSDLDSNDKTLTTRVLDFIEGISGLTLIGNGEWLSRLQRNVISFEMKKPTKAEQLQLWQDLLGKPAKHIPEQLAKVVAHFDLSAKTIQTASMEIVGQLPRPFRKSKANAALLEGKIWENCCKHTRPSVDELAQHISPVARWEDIVLPRFQKETLREVAQQVKNRDKVYQDWGFDHKSSRGFGISALFTGESGTGKTMAAEVLANELRLDLYRIDLSQVVNKYIGETEKNLKRIFDAAEAGGAILLFDEADALFGKRSDVKDSHDRYSNIEVSYLLQRMENYRGLAILTTNMKSAIDQAFLRRIRFIIHFSRPDEQLRAEIWKRIFPEKTPLHPNIDVKKLAKLNVPGGNIKNVALNAAFLAAAADQPVEMSHILHAARQEYRKLEKQISRTEIKDW